MLKESFKVFWACAAGAFIGTLITLQFEGMWWLLGLPAGALAGYLSYEWKKVLAAIPAAARVAFPAIWRGVSAAWRWFKTPRWLLYMGLTISVAVIYWLQVNIIKDEALISNNTGEVFIAYTAISIFFLSVLHIFTFSGGFGMVPLALYGEGKKHSESRWVAKGRYNNEDYFLLLSFFPFTFSEFLSFHKDLFVGAAKIVGWALYGIGWCFAGLLWRLPKAIILRGIPAVGKFFWTLFKMIHSDMRVLCATDAVFGTIIGYIFGSAVVGAMVGGAFGVINYALITELLLRRLGVLPRKA